MQPKRLFAASVVLTLLLIAGCRERPSEENITGPSEAEGIPASGQGAADALLKGEDGHDAVYTLSNSTAGNSVLQFERTSSGSLMPAGSFPTGGIGTGSGLGSQGALALDHNLLFAVNAGSDDISVISLREGSVSVVSRVPSGGTMPISVTIHGDELYVLNAGGSGNITGFRGAGSGRLAMLPGSTRPLSGSGVGPAQISFSPDGRQLLVTEKATSKIDVYTISAGGYASGPHVFPSSGNTPFGFAFDSRGEAIVSDAGDGAMTPYAVSSSGFLDPLSGPVPDHQAAPCWVVVTNNSRFAYTTNAHSNNISGYVVNRDGTLTLFNDGGVTAVTNAAPTDMALARDSQYLYNLNSGSGTITSFKLNVANGSLSPLGSVSGLPPSAVGLAAK